MAIINQIVKDNTPTIYIAKKVDSDGYLVSGDEAMDLTGVKVIGNFWGNDLRGQFQSSGIVGAAFKNATSLEEISGSSVFNDAFYLSSGVTSTGLDHVKKISGSSVFSRAFYGTALTSTGLTSLEWVSGGSAFYLAFSGTHLTVEAFPNFWYIGDVYTLDGAFSSITTLTSASFPKLNVIYSALANNFAVFNGCENLGDVYLGGITAGTFSGNRKSQFAKLFNTGSQYTAATGSAAPNGCTLHLPTNFDPNSATPAFDVTTLDGYPTFGGDAQYIHLAYDQTPLPMLIGADGKLYDRRFVYDTATALCWGIGYETTKYYTSGTTLPAVGDTIYSNATCTTAVTTIDSIA